MNQNRRRFLKGLGATALGVPLLSGLLGRVADAGVGAAPLRFVLVFTGNGQLPSHWLPTGGATGFTLSSVLDPLTPMRDKLLLMRGFEGQGSHSVGMSETTTGRPARDGSGVPTGGPSIDQFLAHKWRSDTPLQSLELGVLPANDPYDHIVYSAAGLPIPPIATSIGGFDRVFSFANEDPVHAELRRSQKRSVLDLFASDLGAIQSKIGASSRRLLDEHLTLIRAQEEQLNAPYIPVTCDEPVLPSGGTIADTWSAHNDVITSAFRCDVTRVATIRVGGWGGIESGGYVDLGIAAGHHDAAHGGSANPDADLRAINHVHATQLADLLAKLDAVDEANGTLLDNTVVIWANEFGLGDFNAHSRDDIHLVLAGGSNAGMANGRFTELSGVDYGHFLYSLTHLMGHPETASFGDRGDLLVPELWA